MNIYRVDDLLPALEVRVEDAGLPVDVTSLNVYMRWERPSGTTIAERSIAKVDPAQGICSYVWEEGDLSEAGIYKGLLQLSPSATPSVRQSLSTPPELYVEVLPNSFSEQNEEFTRLVPHASSASVALIMGEPHDTLDSAAVVAAIDRAQRLAYINCHLFLLGGSLTPVQTEMLRDLVAQLAAMMLMQPPTVAYGPYQRETMASYSYDLKKINTKDDLYGVPTIDAIILYFREHVQSVANPSMWVAYPEWWQPVTERLVDPSRLGTLPL